MFASFKRRWLEWLRNPTTPQARDSLYMPKEEYRRDSFENYGYCCLAGVCILTGEGDFHSDGSFAPGYVRDQYAGVPSYICWPNHSARKSSSLIPYSIAIAAGITNERMERNIDDDGNNEVDIKFFRHEIPSRMLNKVLKDYDVRKDFYTAAQLNDRGLTFLEIAEIVENAPIEIPD